MIASKKAVSPSFLKNLLLLACFSSLCFFHISTLDRRLIDVDEITFADYALDLRADLWKGIVPATYRPMEDRCSLGSSPIYFFIIVALKFLMKTTGIHFWSLRIASCLGGLFGLALFCSILATRFGAKAYFFLGLGFTQLFFYITHSARPEGVIFFIGMLSLWWAFKKEGVLLGFLAGVLFGLAGGMHPQIILFVLPVLTAIAIQFRAGHLQKNDIAAWIVGGVVGAVLVIHFSDMNSFFVYSKINYGQGKAFVIPLLYWKWNLFGLIDSGVDKLVYSRYFWKNPSWAFLWALFLVSFSYCCLAFKKFDASRKNLILIAAGFMAGHFFINGSPTNVYQIFFFPWAVVCSVFFVVDLFRSKEIKKSEEVFFILLAAYAATKSFDAPLFLFAFPIFLRIVLPSCRSRRGIVLLVLLVAVAIINLDTTYSAYFYLKNFFRLRYLLGFFIFLWPWIFIRLKNAQWKLGVLSSRTVRCAPFLCVTIISIGGVTDLQELFRDQLVSNTYSARVSEIISRLPSQPRILGPGEWWFTNPNLPIRDASKLVIYLDEEPHRVALDGFLSFRPTKAYWPLDRKELLTEVNVKFQKPVFEFGEVLDLPTGKWIEVICNYKMAWFVSIRRRVC